MTVGEWATPSAGVRLARPTGDDGSALADMAPQRAHADAEGDEAPAAPARRLPYNPALDGIRGLAVAAVLLFHGELTWARGGYLGVSTFFTLSGFLITSLLVVEHRNDGRVSLTGFWGRRVRRLLPAAVLTLLAVVLAAPIADQAWERTMTGDVVSSALNVANWHFLVDGVAYGARFDPTATSPMLHFWSLAIEEQFYWLFPLLTVGVLAVGRGSLRVYAAVLTGLLGVSALLTWQPGLLGIDRPDADVVYYATPIRMGEIVVGALLALALSQAWGERLSESRRWRAGAVVLGGLALMVSVWAWSTVGRDTALLSDGGLLLYACVSAALVLGACVPGPLRRALAFEPLRLLGVVSYGVYLFHWPIFRLVDVGRVDGVLEPLGGWQPRGMSLFALRVGLTVVLAVASYHLVEQPIRTGRRPAWTSRLRLPRLPGTLPLAAGGSVAVVVVAAVVVPDVSPAPVDPFTQAADSFAEAEITPSDVTPDSRVAMVLGDSTMHRTAWGLTAWGVASARLVVAGGAANIGCGIGRGGEVDYEGDIWPLEPICAWDETMPTMIAEARRAYGRVDFAVVQTGPWDVTNRKVDLDGDGHPEWAHIGQPAYDTWLRGELEAANDLLLAQGMSVVWLTAPDIETGLTQVPPPTDPYPESDPARMDRLNSMIRAMAETREGVVVVDLAGSLASLPPGEDERLRPDGVHFDIETTAEVAAWLGPAVLQASDDEPVPAADEPGAGS